MKVISMIVVASLGILLAGCYPYNGYYDHSSCVGCVSEKDACSRNLYNNDCGTCLSCISPTYTSCYTCSTPNSCCGEGDCNYCASNFSDIGNSNFKRLTCHCE